MAYHANGKPWCIDGDKGRLPLENKNKAEKKKKENAKNRKQ